MQVRNYTDARNNLKDCIDSVHDTLEPVLITRVRGGNAILIAESEWNSITETLYLLGNRANAEHLFKAMDELEAGNVVMFDPDHREAAE